MKIRVWGYLQAEPYEVEGEDPQDAARAVYDQERVVETILAGVWWDYGVRCSDGSAWTFFFRGPWGPKGTVEVKAYEHPRPARAEPQMQEA